MDWTCLVKWVNQHHIGAWYEFIPIGHKHAAVALNLGLKLIANHQGIIRIENQGTCCSCWIQLYPNQKCGLLVQLEVIFYRELNKLSLGWYCDRAESIFDRGTHENTRELLKEIIDSQIGEFWVIPHLLLDMWPIWTIPLPLRRVNLPLQ